MSDGASSWTAGRGQPNRSSHRLDLFFSQLRTYIGQLLLSDLLSYNDVGDGAMLIQHASGMLVQNIYPTYKRKSSLLLSPENTKQRIYDAGNSIYVKMKKI